MKYQFFKINDIIPDMIGKIVGKEYRSYNVEPRSSFKIVILIIDDNAQRPKMIKEATYRLFNTIEYISSLDESIERKTVKIIPRHTKVKTLILIIIDFIEIQ